MDPSQLQQYISAYGTAMQQPAGGAPMTAGGSQQGLQSYFNTPAYSLLQGQQGAQADSTAAGNGTYSPQAAFQHNPGYQFALQQGNLGVATNAASRGLLDSGAGMKAADQYNTGMAQQGYQQFLGQNEGLFNNYQQQLAGLASMGVSNSGAQSAVSTGNNLAGILSNANLGTAQQLSNANLQTGSNISGLFANQGIANANAYLNTGAAQSNNLFQGSVAQQQLNSNNLASNAGSQSNQNNLNTFQGSLNGGTF